MSDGVVGNDESFERAPRRFEQQCEMAGILSDLRRHRHYEKPSERREHRLAAAHRKSRRPRQLH